MTYYVVLRKVFNDSIVYHLTYMHVITSIEVFAILRSKNVVKIKAISCSNFTLKKKKVICL